MQFLTVTIKNNGQSKKEAIANFALHSTISLFQNKKNFF